jgi:hypothetical protein
MPARRRFPPLGLSKNRLPVFVANLQDQPVSHCAIFRHCMNFERY